MVTSENTGSRDLRPQTTSGVNSTFWVLWLKLFLTKPPFGHFGRYVDTKTENTMHASEDKLVMD